MDLKIKIVMVIKMIGEFMNTFGEWHAFVLGLMIMLIISVLVSWAYYRKGKESVWQELLISAIIFLILVVFILRVPEQIISDNFYSEPWYVLFGGTIGLMTGIFIVHHFVKYDGDR